MSTPCAIGYKNTDNSYDVIYCHWDGYPSYQTEMLLNYYNSAELARALIDLGDISSLDKHLAPAPGVVHTFDKPAEDVTVAYHRDRGEDFNLTHVSDKEQLLSEYGSNYLYVFDSTDGKWYINKHCVLEPLDVPLTDDDYDEYL